MSVVQADSLALLEAGLAFTVGGACALPVPYSLHRRASSPASSQHMVLLPG